jgi:hypothetical protein
MKEEPTISMDGFEPTLAIPPIMPAVIDNAGARHPKYPKEVKKPNVKTNFARSVKAPHPRVGVAF